MSAPVLHCCKSVAKAGCVDRRTDQAGGLLTFKFKGRLVIGGRRERAARSSCLRTTQCTGHAPRGPGACGDVFPISTLINCFLINKSHSLIPTLAIQLGLVVSPKNGLRRLCPHATVRQTMPTMTNGVPTLSFTRALLSSRLTDYFRDMK